MAYKKAIVFLIGTHTLYTSLPLLNIAEHRRIPFPESITVRIRDKNKQETCLRVHLNSTVADLKKTYASIKRLPKASALKLELRYRPEEYDALIAHQEFLYQKPSQSRKHSNYPNDTTANDQEQYECHKIIGSLANKTPLNKLFAGRWILFGWYGLDVKTKKKKNILTNNIKDYAA